MANRNPAFLLSMGTRPEIIKMAPVYLELKRRGANTLLLHTGQHSDMAAPLYALFGITPDFDIPLDRAAAREANGGDDRQHCDLALLSSLLLARISSVLLEADPYAVLVHGDTSSALMAALAAFYQQRRVAHVEAGLRSHNLLEPFPEEMNRSVIGRLTYWHFAPTPRARQNLLAEGIPAAHIHVVGNTIVDAVQAIEPDETAELVQTLKSRITGHRLALVTVHRRENHEHGVASIAQAVRELLERHTDLLVVWPVHPNPKVAAAVELELQNMPEGLASRLYLTSPLDYPVLLWVLKNAWVVLTDSGGIQEEAVALGKPVLILRDTTERPEVLETGTGKLLGTKKNSIISEVGVLYSAKSPAQNPGAAMENPFGDGRAAQKICDILLKNV